MISAVHRRTGVALGRASIARNSKSFALASRLLPRGCRDDAAVIYAWCRQADDAVDLAASGSGAAALAQLRGALDEVFRGQPADPIRVELARVVRRTHIPRAYFDDLLAGLEMDLSVRRYATLDDLLLYAYRVAGTVGLMMCHVMGVSERAALPHAIDLGIAMQLTNICRDVVEDWQRGRLYVPEDLLARFGAPGLADELGGAFPAGARGPMSAAVAQLLREADWRYASGERGLGYLPRRCALAIRTAAAVYAEIGRRIEARRCDVTQGRAVVPLSRKLALTARSIIG